MHATSFFSPLTHGLTLWLAGGLLLGCLGFRAARGPASHHFESDLAKKHPAFDLTDLFVFPAETPGKTVFMLDLNPKTGKDGQAAFGTNGFYNLHIAADTTLSTGLTLTLRFAADGVTVGRLSVPNAPLGTEGTPLGRVKVGGVAQLPNGMRIWTGAARDPFVGNSAGLTKFRNALAQGRYDAAAFDNGQDFFAALNSSIVVLEVPNELLPKNIHVFASSTMQLDGEWVQVNRLANPLLTHLFLLANNALALDHVQQRPNDDQVRLLPLSGLVLRAVTLAGTQSAAPVAYADAIAHRLLPDLLPYQVGTPAAFTAAATNGRRPTDDAMDVMLTVFAGQPVTDKANTFDRHPKAFPYVVPIK